MSAPGEASVRAEAARLLREFPRRRPSERLDQDGLQLAARDRSLLREIVLGCLRRRTTLDAVVSAFTKHVEPPVLPFLHVGAYQLLFLDRVPAFAAISETLKASEPHLGRKRRAFLNAVLRRIAEHRGHVEDCGGEAVDRIHRGDGRTVLAFAKPVFPDPAADLAAYAAAQYALPVALVQRWLHQHGPETALALFRETIRHPRFHFRRLPHGPTLQDIATQLVSDGVELEPDETTDGFRTDQVAAVLASAAFVDGQLVVQGEAAARSIDLLDVAEDARVLDLCAAPGGKGAVLARRLGPAGTLWLCDRDATRLELLRSTLERIRPRCPVRTLELPREREALASFQPTHVLVDAPCSNTGVLSRRVEARWAFQPRRLPEIVARQRELLAFALSLAGPRTQVLYATCSLEPEENRGVVEAVALSTGWRLVEEHTFLPRGGADGGYAARLARVDPSEPAP